MSTDPRPSSWRRRHLHEMVTTRSGWSGAAHVSGSCGSWGKKLDGMAGAETAWRNHIQGKISAANRKPLLDRSLSQLWSGEPDP